MLQQRVVWCTTSNDPEGIQFSEVEYIAGIQRYLEVDADDPTRIVQGYINAWWRSDDNQPDFPLYAFDPHDHLAVHRPQVSNMLVIYLLFTCLARLNSLGETYGQSHMLPATWLKFSC